MTEGKSERNPLFRESAAEKLGSPDELDRLMHVTTPKGWLALIALATLVAAASVWGVFGSIPLEVGGQQAVLLHAGARHAVVSQVPGLVVDVMVAEGEDIKEGQAMAKVRLSGGQVVDVQSLFDGTVDELAIGKGMVISLGQEVAIVEKGNEPLQALALVPIDQAEQLKKGMLVHLSPSTANSDKYGFMKGTIASISAFPISREEAKELFLNESLVDTLYTKDNQLAVAVDLLPDVSTRSGYAWSSSDGPPFTISHGTLCTATFVLATERPINLVLPSTLTVR